MPIAKYKDATMSTSWTLIPDISITISTGGIYRITASQNYYNTEPRGILISDSDTDYSAYHLACKYETTNRENYICTSITCFCSPGNRYVFAKAATSDAVNRISIVVERLL